MSNEPAFPFTYMQTDPNYPPEQRVHVGMSLRDWFAGQALAGGMVSDTMKEYQLAAAFGSHRTGITREEIIVANAYRLADAMLAQSPQDTKHD